MNNIIIIILLLVFFLIILKMNVTEKFIEIDQIINKNPTDTMEGALKLSSVTDTKRFENIIGEDLLTTLIEDDVDDTEDPEENSSDTSTGLSIAERQRRNKLAKQKIFIRKYNIDNTLNNISNELYSLLKQRQDVNSIEYDNYSRNLYDLISRINKLKEKPSYDSDIEISRLYNEIAFVYINNNNLTKSLENIETALNYLSKIPEYFNPLKLNYYKGLTYHNKGIIRKNAGDLEKSKKKYETGLKDVNNKSNKKLSLEDSEILNNCKSKIILVKNDLDYINNGCFENNSKTNCPKKISFSIKDVDGVWINPTGLDDES